MEYAESGIRGPLQWLPGGPGGFAPGPWGPGKVDTQSEAKLTHAEPANHESITMLDEEKAEEEEEILTTSEEVEIDVAADSGAVAHTTGPDGLPGTVRVVKKKIRNFVGAGGDGITHHGTARVRLQQENGRFIQNDFEVADVCRPLHSVSAVCDNEHDFLFTRKCGYVVPAWVFDEILAKVEIICKYPRRGGLYVATMKATDPTKRSKDGDTAPFAGQGAGR